MAGVSVATFQLCGNCFGGTLNIAELTSLCLCCKQENIVAFENNWLQLKSERDDVMNRIEAAERQQMRRTATVNLWLERITTLESSADTLIRAYTQERAKTCCWGVCRKNFKKCYKLKKEMTPMVKEVKELLDIKHDVVAERILLAPTQQMPTEPTTGMELMLDEAMRQIADDEKVGMIGLYGMGGVGKTTLLKEINNKLCNSSSLTFDMLLWVVVSKTPNLADIQNNIGKKLGMPYTFCNGESQEQKALDIFNVLDKKKYIVLLDDIWDQFDLTKVGLPIPSTRNKSKVIFTARSKKLCGEMKAREIHVKCLTKEESWNLFRENVGEATLKAHPDIPELANIVMKECKGLPLALKVIGRAMASKTSPHSWSLAIKLLERNIAAELSGMGDEVFPILKYSFDSLPNSSIKSCFLYCSLYPEDEEIWKDDVIDKWICEGYLGRFHNLYDNREEGHDYISTLVNASLLEECSSPNFFKMHDVIRDMAIWIGCECGKMKDKFLVQTRCKLEQIPNFVNWECVERMSFIDKHIEKLTGIQPHRPKTLTLFLHHNSRLNWIGSDFFESLINLRVLDLSSNYSLKVLPNKICELVNLQYLNLSSTDLEELPAEFKKLVALEYLNLELTKTHRNIREGELRSCEKLKVLKLGKGYYERSRDVHVIKDGGDHPTSSSAARTLSEDMNSLECLQDLTFTISGETNLSEFTSLVKLLSITTKISLRDFDSSMCLDMSFLEMMTHLVSLDMSWIRRVEKINVRNESCFNSLLYLTIENCSMLEDLTWIALAPNIEYIYVHDCKSMKRLVGRTVWDEQERRRIPFSKLKSLILVRLPELGSIYPTSLPFTCLSKLIVYDCEKLKKLPFNSNSCNEGQIRIVGSKEDWWNNLEWEDEPTKTKFSSTFLHFRDT